MANVDPDLYEDIKRLKSGLEEHGIVFDHRFHNGMLEVKIQDPADKRRLAYNKKLTSADVFIDLVTQIERVYGWSSDDTYKAMKMAEYRAQETAWLDRREADPEWDQGAFERAMNHARDELDNNRMRVEWALVDRERAYELLLDHDMANRRRGLEDDPGVSYILENRDVFVKQRKRSKAHGMRLGKAIADGRFKLTHQGIAIADDGFLLDGQHRIMEVAIKGLPIAIMVVHDAPDEIFPFIDTGKRRSPGDVLYMKSGIKSGGQINTVIRLLNDYDTTRDQTQWHKRSLDPDEVADLLVEKYINVIEAFKIGNRVAAHANVHLSKIAVAAATFVALRAWPDAPIEAFWNSSKGRSVDPYYHKTYAVDQFGEHPAMALQQFGAGWDRRLTNAKSNRKGAKNTEHFIVALRAWNAACRGETVGRYGYDERRQAPEPYTPGQ